MDEEQGNNPTPPVNIQTDILVSSTEDNNSPTNVEEISEGEPSGLNPSEGSLDSNREINWLASGNSSETSEITRTSPTKYGDTTSKDSEEVKEFSNLSLEDLPQGDQLGQQRHDGYEKLKEDGGADTNIQDEEGCLVAQDSASSSDAISPISDSGQTLSSPPYSSQDNQSNKTSPYDSSATNDSSPGDVPGDTGLRISSSQLGVDTRQRTAAVTALSNVEATGVVGKLSSREDSIGSLPDFHGTVTHEGEMVSFVADDLIEKIRQSASSTSTSPANSQKDNSPTTASISSSSSQFSMRSSSVGSISAIPPVDAVAVMDLERHCKRVADSMDLMFGHLAGTLHNMSAITVGHTQTYRDAVEKAGITVDQSVRSMYALMAKCEELQKKMHAMRDLAKQIRTIKRQLDELEAVCK